MKIRPWHFGNTTVCSPFRLREGLIALAKSPLGRKLKGKDQESKFAWVLHNSGVENISIPDGDVSGMGRKWCSAMNKMGFLYPELPASAGITPNKLGDPFAITNNGQQLIEATSVSAMQECFLRSMAAIYIPSLLERGYSFSIFSPLRHILKIMLELEKRTGESRLNPLEMGVFVQFSSSKIPAEQIVDDIMRFRADRDVSDNKRKFDQVALNNAALHYDYKSGSFKDYADLNFRYLKATGLMQNKGRGITLVPGKRLVVEQLVTDTGIPANDKDQLMNLCNGATLPTDNRDEGIVVLKDLVEQVKQRGIDYSLTDKILTSAADVTNVRHDVEEILSRLDEGVYAECQANEWEEIAAYMELLINHRHRHKASDEDTITIPQIEAPAYFEWVLWRAFLSIDSLKNKPYEARRFKVDQDFLPVGTAPGNGPDLIFEFKDFVIVVEVTLTDNSQQEAAEGESVRQHVADLVMKYEKPVYGLFIANRIDSNTAETFRIGVWYTQEDDRMSLDIVPFTLAQFKVFFEAMFISHNVRADDIRELLDICGELRQDLHAPEWKAEIEKAVQIKATALVEST
jgi:hypothetical protein